MLYDNQTTVVLNEKTIGILWPEKNSIEVLSTRDPFVRDEIVSIRESDVVREAVKFDFHRLGLSYNHTYLENNTNYDGNTSTDEDILDEIYADDEAYKVLKHDVNKGDKFHSYDVTFTNGQTIRHAALCLFNNVLNSYSNAKSVVSYVRLSTAD